ncbi:MAG: hypothetical protein KAH21_06060 [Spirochaetaceae bacterium]|nr:hypothetical protein [Spirochaetaceae bacterium]
MSGHSKAGKILDHLTGSASTKFLINQFIKDYGRLFDLKIDRRNKSITASLQLNGENQLIDLFIKDYTVIKTETSTSLLIKDAESGRPWLNAILRNHIIGRPWLVPEDRAAILDDLLG